MAETAWPNFIKSLALDLKTIREHKGMGIFPWELKAKKSRGDENQIT